jgi:hypothetical protein
VIAWMIWDFVSTFAIWVSFRSTCDFFKPQLQTATAASVRGRQSPWKAVVTVETKNFPENKKAPKNP